MIKYKDEKDLQKDVVRFLRSCSSIGFEFTILPNLIDHMAEKHPKKRMVKIQGAGAVGYEEGQSDLLILSNKGNVFIELKNGYDKIYTKKGVMREGKVKKQYHFLGKTKLCSGFKSCFFGYELLQIIDELRKLYDIPNFDFKPKYNLR